MLLYAGSNTSESAKDIVFVIDASGSIGSLQFQLIREFIANITAELIRNSPRIAVGVILFDDTAHIEFNLRTYTSLNALLSVISELPYTGRGTNTFDALRVLSLTAQNGALGLRSDSSKVAIIITDGQSNNQSATLQAADALHASNIFDVYAVGVGRAHLNELEAIGSSPEFIFLISSFNRNNLQKLQEEILSQLQIGEYYTNILITEWLHS